MDTTSTPRQTPGYVTFRTLQANEPAPAWELAETATDELRDKVCGFDGFLAARVHIGTDSRTVVIQSEWRDVADHRRIVLESPETHVLRELVDRSGVVSEDGFGGVPAPGIDGPDAGEEPGVVIVATRHVGGRDNARELAGLLLRSGEWKRRFPGFIGATPYISSDGATYVNYVRWLDEDAFRAYMADPRNAAGQADIAHLEVAEPEFVRCTVVESVSARKSSR